jgi:hypothetical protein
MVILQIMDETVEALKAKVAALESELAALANQEPCEWQYRDGDHWFRMVPGHAAERFYSGFEIRALYAHPPAATSISLIDERQPDGSLIVSAMQGDEEVARMCLPAAAASEDARDAERWRAVSSILSADEIKDIAIIVAHERGVDVANAFNKTSEHLIDAAIAAKKESKT